MANTKSAAKRARQTKHRTLNNSRAGTQVKSAKRKLRDLIKAGDKAGAAQAYKEVSSVLDRAAKRGVLHKNNASRNKSRLRKALKGLAA
jgi:small subunit ribosomal protein S20